MFFDNKYMVEARPHCLLAFLKPPQSTFNKLKNFTIFTHFTSIGLGARELEYFSIYFFLLANRGRDSILNSSLLV